MKAVQPTKHASIDKINIEHIVLQGEGRSHCAEYLVFCLLSTVERQKEN